MDIVLSLGALVVIAPLLVLIAIAIKLDSHGPVLFRQMRMGLGGRRFQILKFRTMVADADQQKARLVHLNQYRGRRGCSRSSTIRASRAWARLLRKTSLDELPQLWNVLRGDMSLVGPRPCVPEEFEHYAPHHMERLFVVPGVTGPWQVSGRNSVARLRGSRAAGSRVHPLLVAAAGSRDSGQDAAGAVRARRLLITQPTPKARCRKAQG